MKIYCVECKKEVEANLITGKEAYPHRPDLYEKYLYQCPICKNFVGTHKGTKEPLGCIPTKELKRARMRIHDILDPLWKSSKISRKEIYKYLSKELGYDYHTANIKSLNEVYKVENILKLYIKNYY